MAGVSYINIEGDYQMMITGKNIPESSSICPRTTSSRMSQEGGSSSRKRKRNKRRPGQDNPLLLVRPLRVPKILKQPPPSPVVPFRIIDPTMTKFLFEKKLHQSDVGRAGRIVLPKKLVEDHLPYLLCTKEGVWMHVDDMDYYKVWTLKFRFWQNNTSRIYIFGNAREFVTSHGLNVGDSIKVFKDIMTESYLIRAAKSSCVPSLIYEQCLLRSKENDSLFLNHPEHDSINKNERVQSAPEPLENNDVLLNQEPEKIINNEEELQLSERERASTISLGGSSHESNPQPTGNSSPKVYNENFPPLDDSLGWPPPYYGDFSGQLNEFDLYGTTGMVDPMGEPFYRQHHRRSPSIESITFSLWD